jgi:hypothetical protein
LDLHPQTASPSCLSLNHQYIHTFWCFHTLMSMKLTPVLPTPTITNPQRASTPTTAEPCRAHPSDTIDPCYCTMTCPCSMDLLRASQSPVHRGADWSDPHNHCLTEAPTDFISTIITKAPQPRGRGRDRGRGDEGDGRERERRVIGTCCLEENRGRGRLCFTTRMCNCTECQKHSVQAKNHSVQNTR